MPLFRTVSESLGRRNFRNISAHILDRIGAAVVQIRRATNGKANITDTESILSEIEFLVANARYHDATVLMNFVDQQALDRKSRLNLLLINVTLDGATAHKNDIDELCGIADPSDAEKELIDRILRLESEPAPADWRAEQSAKSFEVTQAYDQAAPSRALEPQRREAAESLQNHASEPVAGATQRGELDAEQNPAVQSLEKNPEQSHGFWNQELLFNALQIRFSATIRSLQSELNTKEARFETREAEIEAIRVNMDRVNMQLAEFLRAKEQIELQLHAEASRKSELLQIQDTAIKTLEDRFAAQFYNLESQLVEKHNLLESRATELEFLKEDLNQLTRESTMLLSERQRSDRRIQEELRETSLLLQTKASAGDEIAQQMSAKIESLERQLAENQKLLESGTTEIGELRRQVFGLTKKFAEVEGTQNHANTLLNEKPRKLDSQEELAVELVHDGAVDRLTADHTRAAWTPFSSIISACDINLGRLKRQLLAWQFPWKPKAFPPATLPIAVVGLMLISIAYISIAYRPEVPDPISTPRSDRVVEPAPPGSAAPPAIDLAARDSVDVKNRSAKTGEARPKVVTGYVTRRAVSLRQWPRYAATPMGQLPAGTSISVLDVQGSWLKVKTSPSGEVGYVRKEHLVYKSPAR